MKRLVALPLSKSVEIAFKNIRVRFYRSLITTISLVLAVAFLSFSQVSDNVAQSILTYDSVQYRSKLVSLGYDLSAAESSITTSPKQRWIVMLSLLVCVVGIVNAQLMSVTERFREIGTMKCLGALDKFVVRIFIIEAAFQGITGATAGALLGGAAALATGIIRFGFDSIVSLSWYDVGSSVVIAIATGTLLSLLGVLYPALMAARMQPVEAMRVEQ